MSSENPEIVDSANPWPGPSSFTESNREYFHGREEETAELFRLVKRETMTVLFGQSGIGKTSLLNAGLFPLLRSEPFLPVYVRLGFDDNNEPLVEQVKKELQTACAREGVEALPFKTAESLWEYFHRTDADLWNRRNKLITPVLIFDRFEALFTLGSSTQTIRSRCNELILQLSDLVRNHCPARVQALFDTDPALMRLYDFDKEHFKIILSLREDFLANLEDLQNELPVKKNRLRLRQMNGVRARDAIINVGGHLIEDGLAESIVRFVAGSSGGSPASSATKGLDLLDIEPALLSIVCRELNNQRIQKGLDKITAGLLSGSSGQILEDFYGRGILGVSLGVSPEVKTFIEDRLVTGTGDRTTVALDDALQTAGISRNDIDILVNRRILRFEDRFGARHLELIHDRLTDVVKNRRDKRREREAAEQADRERREALRKMREKQRRQLTVIVTVAVAAILSMGFAVYGFWQKHKAEILANKSFELLKTFMPDGTTKVYEYFRTRAIESYKEGAYENAITHLKSANLSPDMPATNDLAEWKDNIDTYQRLGQQADKELEKRNFTEAQKLCEQILAGNEDSRADTSRLSLCKLFTEQLILVRGGSFNMGGQETMLRNVSLDSFYISRCEITNAQYAHFLNQYGSDRITSGDYEGEIMVDKLAWGVTSQGKVWFPQPGYEDHPVVGVTWYGANEFCRFYGGSLPTEAQWEYAARSGGKEEKYAGTSDESRVGEYAWFRKNSDYKTHKVGTRNPNGLGLHDMSGNVWEWCSDWYGGDYYKNSPKDNPLGPASGSPRVDRGGSWYGTAGNLRASRRDGGPPASRGGDVGFRLTRTP